MNEGAGTNKTHADEGERNLLHSAGNLARSTTGATLIEYALLLALVVVGGLAAYLIFSAKADQGFVAASRIFEPGSGSRRASSAAGPTGNESRSVDLPQSEWMSGRDGWTANSTAAMLGVAAWAVTLVISAALFRRIRRGSGNATRDGGQQTLIPLPPGAHEKLVEKRQQIRRLLSRDFENSQGLNTQVRHLMSNRLMIFTRETPARQAIDTMRDQHVRHVLVCRNGRSLEGIISDRDVKERTGETAGDLMTADPIAVRPEMAIGPAISIMIEKRISCLPVVDEEGVCGVLTTTDLMLTLQCVLQVLSRAESCPVSV